MAALVFQPPHPGPPLQGALRLACRNCSTGAEHAPRIPRLTPRGVRGKTIVVQGRAGLNISLDLLKNRNRLHMRGMREHVGDAGGLEGIAFDVAEHFGVAGQGGGVAGDVNDAAGRVVLGE